MLEVRAQAHVRGHKKIQGNRRVASFHFGDPGLTRSDLLGQICLTHVLRFAHGQDVVAQDQTELNQTLFLGGQVEKPSRGVGEWPGRAVGVSQL